MCSPATVILASIVTILMSLEGILKSFSEFPILEVDFKVMVHP